MGYTKVAVGGMVLLSVLHRYIHQYIRTHISKIEILHLWKLMVYKRELLASSRLFVQQHLC